MADPHQIHSLIAAAISECGNHNLAGDIFPEAKIMAKCVVQQLGDAGFLIVLSAPDKDGALTVTRGAADSTTESSADG